MQGRDPTTDPVFLQRLRKSTGWRPPAEVDGLPQYPGWAGLGVRIRDALGADKMVENTRVAVAAALSQADPRVFPPQPSAYQALRLRQKVEQWIDDLRRRKGLPPPSAPDAGVAVSPPPPAPPPPANPASFGE
jgi:hypothetical protein